MAKIQYTKKTYKQHSWVRDDNGEIDYFAYCFDFHNGPRCKRCNYEFCEHCNPGGLKNTPCTVETWKCPKCKFNFGYCTKDNFCRNCGEPLDWNVR